MGMSFLFPLIQLPRKSEVAVVALAGCHCEFPLIQLPRKSEGAEFFSALGTAIGVSINSTSEEVRSLRSIVYMPSYLLIVSINSTSEEVRSGSFENSHLVPRRCFH